MAVERAASGSSLIDVLDRVLDKGIVIDAWVRVSLVGIDLITVEARVVVASIDTYLKYSEAVGAAATASRPAVESKPYEEPAADGGPPPSAPSVNRGWRVAIGACRNGSTRPTSTAHAWNCSKASSTEAN